MISFRPLRRWLADRAALLPGSPPEVRFPDPDVGVDSLAARARAQQEAAGRLGVFHQFRFTDRLNESGITFVHRAVDDVRKNYRPVHYDHGNGIAAADVDGDGRHDIYFVNQVGGNELWKNLGGGSVPEHHARRGRRPCRSASA